MAPGYQVEREIGRGGMGAVFLGRDPTLDRPVAIKVLLPEVATAVTVERFLREARVLARLRHPAVISIHQAGNAHGILYFVMDYAEGETLAARLGAGRLDHAEVIQIGQDLLAALAAAHTQGVIHRDIKPSNVFLDRGRACLADFGIAKTLSTSSDQGLTVQGRLLGTPSYMSPEQLAGLPASAESDLYSIGLVLYECFTGRRWNPVTSPETGDWTGIPAELVPVLRRALALEPERRWASAETFRAALVPRTAGPLASRRVRITATLGFAAAAGWLLYLAFVRPPEPSGRPLLEIQGFTDEAGRAGGLGDSVANGLVQALLGAADFEVVHAPAARTRGAFRVDGTVRRRGDSLVVSAYFSQDGAPRQAMSEVAGPLERWGDVVDQVAGGLVLLVMRGGEELPADALPRSPRELLHWASGEVRYYRGQWDSAYSAYRLAEADTSCLHCAYRINDISRWLAIPLDTARVNRLRRGVGRFSPYYQRLIRALFTPLPARLDSLRDVSAAYFSRTEAAYRYGDELFNRGPLYGIDRDEAREQLAAAVRLDSTFIPSWYDLATILVADGDSAEALLALSRLEHWAGAGASRAALAQVAWQMRFGVGVEAGARSTLETVRALGFPPEAAAGPRLLHAWGLPQGAVALGTVLGQLQGQSGLARSGLVAQATGYLALGRPKQAMAVGARIVDAGWNNPVARHYPELLVALQLAFEDSLTSDLAALADSATGLAQGGVAGDPGPRYSAALIGGIRDARRGDAAAFAQGRAWLRDEPVPQPRRKLLDAWDAVLRGDTATALRLSAALLADSIVTLGEAYGDRFLRSAIKLSRAEWLRGTEAGAAELRWTQHLHLTVYPLAEPISADTDWALATIAYWRLATWGDRGTRAAGVCRAYREVARRWSEAEEPYLGRADAAARRASALGCPAT